MDVTLTGPVICVGDNVDTDQIFPGRFLELTDPGEIGSRCLSGVDPDIAPGFPKGGIVAAGRNFGCGSSREHAPIALLNMGASAVLADSFARIFFRNAINLGLPVVVCRGVCARVRTGEHVALDLEAGTATILERGEVLLCDRLGEQARRILEAGGIKPLMRKRFGRNNGQN